jgi:methylated-DNA-[protein]-cysteine S-methyltransferase
MNYQTLDTPIGKLRLVSDGKHLTALEFQGHHQVLPEDLEREDETLRQAAAQLGEYFEGKRRDFNLPLNATGTSFQRSVWSALSTIPYGELRSYGEIARAIGRPRAVRAVGAANGRNPLPIVVPCHRVVGADGSLTGFAGGLELKKVLLKHEDAIA